MPLRGSCKWAKHDVVADDRGEWRRPSCRSSSPSPTLPRLLTQLSDVFFFLIYYLTRLQSQNSKLWSFLAVRVLALSRPEVSASSYKQRTKRERGERRKKNMYSQFGKTARCLDEWSSKLGLFTSVACCSLRQTTGQKRLHAQSHEKKNHEALHLLFESRATPFSRSVHVRRSLHFSMELFCQATSGSPPRLARFYIASPSELFPWGCQNRPWLKSYQTCCFLCANSCRPDAWGARLFEFCSGFC